MYLYQLSSTYLLYKLCLFWKKMPLCVRYPNKTITESKVTDWNKSEENIHALNL